MEPPNNSGSFTSNKNLCQRHLRRADPQLVRTLPYLRRATHYARKVCVVEIVVLSIAAGVLFVLVWLAGDVWRWDRERIGQIPSWLIFLPAGVLILSLLGLALGKCNS